ncbi:hypothetical protein [Rhizobium sp. MHM7A]|uniref:hypothetical protein n=1 Tax=Rhizobium sp. MHM7A TaxID=2583233 RepID=UPI001105DA0C|nr:hypothetical protein [Rhizobium sp. MHM7A]TLX15771.1 hypothetical protein FFR93_00190 [Rhizobium sp. MHM7A]
MQTLAGMTAQDGLEHASCLSLVASDIEGLKKEYASLLSKRTSMSDEAYAAAERKLLGDAVWKAGASQSLTRMGGVIKNDEQWCDGEAVAEVHTHPKAPAVHSDVDLFSTVRKSQFHSSFAVFESTVCGIVKTEASPKDEYEARSFYAVAQAGGHLKAVRNSEKITDESLAKSVPGLVARTSESISMGLYCGKLGGPLERVAPSSFDSEDPMFVLMAKGVAISMKYLENGDDLKFPFTPEFDPVFDRYISEGDFLFSEEWATHRSPAEAYRRMVYVAAVTQSMVAMNFIDIPGTRSERETTFYRTFCSSEAGMVCFVLERYGNVESSTNNGVLARYRFEERQSILVDRIAGKYVLDERMPGNSVYKGECSFVETRCRAHGVGTLTAEGLQFEGSFTKGSPTGKGIVTFPSGEVWTVNMTNEGFEKLERIK